MRRLRQRRCLESSFFAWFSVGVAILGVGPNHCHCLPPALGRGGFPIKLFYVESALALALLFQPDTGLFLRGSF